MYEILCGVSAQLSMVTLSSHCLQPRSCGEHEVSQGYKTLVRGAPVCIFTLLVTWVLLGLERSGVTWCVHRAGSVSWQGGTHMFPPIIRFQTTGGF